MSKPVLILVAGTLLAGCGTLVDFGPEPGSPGDESFMQYQPELHGPNAPPRNVDQDGRRLPTAGTETAVTPASPAAEPAVAAPAPLLPPPPAASVAPPAPTSEALFNDAIRRAVESGDVDRALRLLEEAERLGSRSARPTFIEAVKAGGN